MGIPHFLHIVYKSEEGSGKRPQARTLTTIGQSTPAHNVLLVPYAP